MLGGGTVLDLTLLPEDMEIELALLFFSDRNFENKLTIGS